MATGRARCVHGQSATAQRRPKRRSRAPEWLLSTRRAPPPDPNSRCRTPRLVNRKGRNSAFGNLHMGNVCEHVRIACALLLALVALTPGPGQQPVGCGRPFRCLPDRCQHRGPLRLRPGARNVRCCAVAMEPVPFGRSGASWRRSSSARRSPGCNWARCAALPVEGRRASISIDASKAPSATTGT